MEMVHQRYLDHLHISFLIAGHTKFAPDRLFSTIGSAYKCEDVFSIQGLQHICEQGGTTHIEDGSKVYMWREPLGGKYSNLPGVRKLHDFLVVCSHDGRVVMKVRERIYTGAWSDSSLRLSYLEYQQTHTHIIHVPFQKRKWLTWN